MPCGTHRLAIESEDLLRFTLQKSTVMESRHLLLRIRQA
jgi:hypothetical protein